MGISRVWTGHEAAPELEVPPRMSNSSLIWHGSRRATFFDISSQKSRRSRTVQRAADSYPQKM